MELERKAEGNYHIFQGAWRISGSMEGIERRLLASKNFGIGERSVYKTLRTGKYQLWRDAEKAMADLLNPKWFELEVEPKMN